MCWLELRHQLLRKTPMETPDNYIKMNCRCCGVAFLTPKEDGFTLCEDCKLIQEDD